MWRGFPEFRNASLFIILHFRTYMTYIVPHHPRGPYDTRFNEVHEQSEYLQLQDDAHHLLVLERIVELCDKMVLQSVHDIDLSLDIPSVSSVRNSHKLSGQLQICDLLAASVHGSEFASAMNVFEFLVNIEGLSDKINYSHGRTCRVHGSTHISPRD